MRYLRLEPNEKSEKRNLPLIFIHGLLGYSFSWRHNLAELARQRPVYAVDLPGIGYSDRPAAGVLDFSLQASAERMLDWLAALGHKRVDVVGSSHGGALAMTMASLSPDRVARLVLVSPANPWSSAGEKRIALCNIGLGAWVVRHLAPWFVQIGLQRMYGNPLRLTRETREGYDRMARLPGTADYALQVVSTWKQDMRQLQESLATLAETPVLLLWGTRDRAVPLAGAYKLKARLPNSELRTIPGAGHLPYEEAPAEFNRLVIEFLDRQQNGRRSSLRR